MTTLPLPAVPLDGGLSQYFQQVFRFPVLKGEEEYMLAKRWKEHGDVEAAHELVTSHLRLVAKIAMSYRGYGLPVADLVSEGNIGLMKAVRKFEPGEGLPSVHLRHVVDQGIHHRIHSEILVLGEVGYGGGPEENVLQPAQAQGKAEDHG